MTTIQNDPYKETIKSEVKYGKNNYKTMPD